MSAARAARARLSRLLVEASVDLGALDALSAELRAQQAALHEPRPSRPILALASVDLHNYYTALESLFERIARHVDEAVPAGADWHVALVDQMAADLPPVRPAVIDTRQRAWLHELRRFRHFFRHAYAVELDPTRLREHVTALLEAHHDLADALERLLEFVRATREALPTDG
jgi:hypothetical protein